MLYRVAMSAVLALTLLSEQSVEAWWSGGHMTVAQIAYERLTPAVKTKVDELISLMALHYPEHDTFVKASTWLDDIHKEDFTIFATWHYLTLPYDPEGILSDAQVKNIEKKNENADIRHGLKQAFKTLGSVKANRLEKGLMLYYLIHCVADAHQPCHTTTLFNQEFPQGDMGGNFFKVDSPIAKNLHLFWDSGLGIIPVVEYDTPLSKASLDAVRDYARELSARLPENSLYDADNLNPNDWIGESHGVAKWKVYQGLEPGGKPSEEYLSEGQKACEGRLALAGYRLAHLLNTLLK